MAQSMVNDSSEIPTIEPDVIVCYNVPVEVPAEQKYQKLKLLKRGQMALFNPLECGVSFYSLPAWH